MPKHDLHDHARTQQSTHRARIERLLFAGATLATTVLAVGNPVDPKLPPFVGE